MVEFLAHSKLFSRELGELLYLVLRYIIELIILFLEIFDHFTFSYLNSFYYLLNEKVQMQLLQQYVQL
jgi:hypothetical protein